MSDALRRTLRTALALIAGIAAGLPLLVHTAGIPDTLPGLGTVLAVASAVTRLLASPVVDDLLPSWLKKVAPKADLPPIGPGPAAATVSLVAEPGDAPAPIVPLQPISPVQPEALVIPPIVQDGGASA